MPSAQGFKHFFTPAFQAGGIVVRGIGLRELMPPVWVERPGGTGDFLFMLFHDPAALGQRESTPLPVNSMVLWPAGDPHFYGNIRRPFNHSWIHCDGPRVSEMLRSVQLPKRSPFSVPDSSIFTQCLLDVHAELVSYAQPDPIIVRNLLENCLREIARSISRGFTASRIPENLITVRRWIGTSPATRVTLGDLAQMAGMSVPHFCARFKETFGLPPIECLIQHRLNHASYLLADLSLNITEIASRVGYDDLFHFSKAFKKQFGLSPRDARKTASTSASRKQTRPGSRGPGRLES